MLAGDEASPWVQLSRWLDGQRIPARMRAPFTTPLACAWRLGLTEIERVVAEGYEREMLADARRIWSRFPFDRSAEVDVSGAEVEAVFAPQGSFWSTFEQLFAPVVLPVRHGGWRARTGPDGRAVSLPRGALTTLARAQRIRSALFSPEGQRQALSFQVRPEPLPVASVGPAATLAVLRAFSQSVLGFNQTPAWQSFSVPWGEGGTAGIGVRASNQDRQGESTYTLDAATSEWTLHRLLSHAEARGGGGGSVTFTWSVPTASRTEFPVRFTFQSDPWAPFQPVTAEGTP
jgi:type VI protein secretion system component VasK